VKYPQVLIDENGRSRPHSLGVLVAVLTLWGRVSLCIITPVVTLIDCVYLVLALLYWFRSPGIGIAIGVGCFGLASVLSLKERS
jgi:hypothetical protein